MNLTELKRLAEDAIDDSRCRHDFQMEVTPKVVLSMFDALDVQAGSIEAVQAANQRLAAEHNKLRTQNQALREACKTGLEYVEECLIDYDQSYAEHPATKGGRGIIKSDIDAINAALAQAEGEV